jgi:hypothetical protein
MNNPLSRLLGIITLASVSTLPLLAQDIGAGAQQQIADIAAAKSNFNAAQKKISSDLVFGGLAAANSPTVASFRDAITPLNGTDLATGQPATTSTGTAQAVTVEIKGTVSQALVDAITVAGGSVVQQSAEFGNILASVPFPSLETIAARGDVTSISTPSAGHTNGGGARPRLMRRPGMERLRAAFAGSVTSQGYITHAANQAVALGYNGSGVTVGVLSDSASATRIAALIASGDLPAGASALAGQNGPATGSDEGAAMMEIVHDIAPGANIIFATASGGPTVFAANIIALKNAGCKVIVDDISYFNEAVFQDGPIAQAVNTVTAAGVIYLSSAGNSGSLTMNTSGTWEGDFVSGGAVTGAIATLGETGTLHSFGAQNYNVLTAASQFISLKWSDPIGGSTNDYDLFILNSTGTAVKGFSASVQNGTQSPYEFVGQGTNCGTASASGYCPAVNDRVVLVLFSGAARALHVDTNRARLSISTSGATYGHNAGANTVSLAATYWNSARTGTKPFTGSANPNESFSSDGPRKIFFNPNGTAITPGNLLFATGGGTTLQKPDYAAADGNSAKTPGFSPFFGTSAAAPHAAGIAALVLSARPTYTVAQIKAALTATALDSMAPGADRDSGFGIAMALSAVQYALSH